ncbi:MAG: hypothetical protein ACR2I5_04970 [Candidatus Limnocylindria bacterium]
MRMPRTIKDKRLVRTPSQAGDGVPGVAPGMGGPGHAVRTLVADVLDPLLLPLGFAPAQVGGDGDRGEVIFCRGEIDSPDGSCVDLVLDLEAAPDWQITDVRYWGFPSDRWRLDFDRDASLADQLAGLAQTLSGELR